MEKQAWGNIMPSCEERIYSNDYYDFLIDYMVEEIQYSNPGLDYCYAKISNLLSAVFVQRNNVPTFSLSEYSYRFVPKLYVPMETVSFPLLKSGILQVHFARDSPQTSQYSTWGLQISQSQSAGCPSTG